MALSTFTGITLIPENSQATPGLWNNIFSTISANLDTLNSDKSVLAASIGTTTSIVGFSSNTLRPETSTNTILVLAAPGGVGAAGVVEKSIDSGGQVYNVLAYGAVPSLAVDSTVAIQRALAAAAASSGGIVYFPLGSYAVSQLTVSRNVTIRGAGGGRNLNAGPPVVIQQTGSVSTALLILADQGGSGVVIEDISLSGNGNVNNVGGVHIAGMNMCELNRVSLSLFTGFSVQIQGGSDSNANVLRDCAITMNTSSGTCIDLEGNAGGNDTGLMVTNCYVTTASVGVAFISIKSTSSGLAPDSPLFVANRFISGSSVTAIYALATNARFIGNRFETTGAAAKMFVTLSPPTGTQPAAFFIANSYAAPGGLTFTDSAVTPSQRLFEPQTLGGLIDTLAGPGTALNPAYAIASERSLGFYKSGTSAIGLSYGQFQSPSGTAVQPPIAFSSESSLGWYRSGASSLALSYGSLSLPGPNYAVMPLGGGINARFVTRGGNQWGFTNNYNAASGADNAAQPIWIFELYNGAGGSEEFDILHAPPSGGVAFIASLNSQGGWFVDPGLATRPGLGIQSEKSLGWYRSAASVMALSYGGLGVKAGANASCGTAVLGSNGSVNVATNYVATGDLIFLTDQTPGGTLGDLEVGGIRAGSGFTIQSTSVTDTSTVGWLIVRPT